jgi:hypothetical protein
MMRFRAIGWDEKKDGASRVEEAIEGEQLGLRIGES